MYQVIDVSAAGAGTAYLDASTAVRGLGGATLVSAGAAATMKIQETNGSGRVLAMLSAAIGTSDHYTPFEPIVFQGQLFITVTGASATALIEIE